MVDARTTATLGLRRLLQRSDGMRLPFKRREQKALTMSGGVAQAIQQGWSPLPQLGGGATQRIIDAFNTAQSSNYSWMYSNSIALRTVIDTLVRNVGQLPL